MPGESFEAKAHKVALREITQTGKHRHCGVPAPVAAHTRTRQTELAASSRANPNPRPPRRPRHVDLGCWRCTKPSSIDAAAIVLHQLSRPAKPVRGELRHFLKR